MNKDTYRNKAVAEYYKIIDTFRAQRRIILDNEAHQPTINLKIANLKKESNTKLRTLIKGLEDTVADAKKVAQSERIKAMRQANDTARAGYVQVNAANAFDGLTGDQIAEKYPDYVANMHPDDKPYRYVVDELVLNKARDEGTREMLKHQIWLNMSAREMVAAGQMDQAEALENSHKTLAGLMEMHLDDISKGWERQTFDVAETFDALIKPKGNHYETPVADNVVEVKINPAE